MKKHIRFILSLVLITMPCSIILPVQNSINTKKQKTIMLSKRFHETYAKLRNYVTCFVSHRDCSKARKVAFGASVILLLLLYGIYQEKSKESYERVMEEGRKEIERKMKKRRVKTTN